MISNKTKHNEPYSGAQVFEYHSKPNGNDIMDVSEESREIDSGFYGHMGKPNMKSGKIGKMKPKGIC